VSGGALSWCNSQFCCHQSSGQSLHTFSCSSRKICGIDCLGCQDKFFVKNPLDAKVNDEHALGFALHLSRFSVSVSLNFSCTAYVFFPERLSNHCKGLRLNFFEICTECNAAHFSDPSRKSIRPDTKLHIKGRKNQHLHPAAWTVLHWLPRYTSTIIYRGIAILQLLYKWHYQSRKLWISLIHI
jgi:hypothetical protein